MSLVYLANNPLTRARQAIADILADLALDHPHISELTTYAYVPFSGNNFPVAFTELDSGTPTTTGKNHRIRGLKIVVLVGIEGTEADSQEFIDYLLEGADTITAALTRNRTLNGTVIDSSVGGDEPLSVQQLAGYAAWGHQWNITIKMGDNHG